MTAKRAGLPAAAHTRTIVVDSSHTDHARAPLRLLQGSEQWESPSGVRSIELVNASACLGKLLSDTGNHRAAVPLLTDAVDGMGYLCGDGHPYTQRLNHSLQVSTKARGGQMSWPTKKRPDMMRADRSRNACEACQAPHSGSRHTCEFRHKLGKYEDVMSSREPEQHCMACQGRSRPHTCAAYSQPLQLQQLLHQQPERAGGGGGGGGGYGHNAANLSLVNPNFNPMNGDTMTEAECEANDHCEKNAFCSRGYRHRGNGGQCNGQKSMQAFREQQVLQSD
jgi:hypothetical protein